MFLYICPSDGCSLLYGCIEQGSEIQSQVWTDDSERFTYDWMDGDIRSDHGLKAQNSHQKTKTNFVEPNLNSLRLGVNNESEIEPVTPVRKTSSVKMTGLPLNYLWTSKLDQSDFVKSKFLCSVSGCRLFLWSVSSEAAVTSSSCPSSPAESSLFLFLSLLKQHQPTGFCRMFAQTRLQVFLSIAFYRGFL